jgi:hypothetical protein
MNAMTRDQEAIYDTRQARWQKWSEILQNCDQASGTAQLQAGGPVQELSLTGGQLEHSAAGSGEGRVPLRRVVPPRRLHRDQPHGGEPGGGCGSTTSAAPQSSGSKKVGG